jgi:hypothetical protein
LFERLIEQARGFGYTRLLVTTHPHNAAMRALARRYNAELVFEDGKTVGTIHLEPLMPVGVISAASQARNRTLHPA